MIEDVVGTYELSSCYNVTIDCRAADMIATVRTNKIFNGKIYAKDNPNSCVVDVDSAIEFNIKMGYNDIGKVQLYYSGARAAEGPPSEASLIFFFFCHVGSSFC